MEIRGLSQQYLDTLTKLYQQHVPSRLRSTRISKIEPKAVANVFGSLENNPGSARTLRAFLGQIIKDVGFYSLPLYRAFYFAREFPAPPRNRHGYEGERWLPKETFAKIFGSLNRSQIDWIQAQFIRLLFEFDVPADRLMKAEWNHIADGHWYPWLQNERKDWWLHTRLIDDTIAALLENLRVRTQQEFGNNRFLFPSRMSATGHIRTFQTVWRTVALECAIHRSDLSALIRSYHWSVVFPRRRIPYRARHYGEIVQELSHGSE
jgi:hypothetical protein